MQCKIAQIFSMWLFETELSPPFDTRLSAVIHSPFLANVPYVEQQLLANTLAVLLGHTHIPPTTMRTNIKLLLLRRAFITLHRNCFALWEIHFISNEKKKQKIRKRNLINTQNRYVAVHDARHNHQLAELSEWKTNTREQLQQLLTTYLIRSFGQLQLEWRTFVREKLIYVFDRSTLFRGKEEEKKCSSGSARIPLLYGKSE